jgi:hypothetical protein
MQEYTMATNVIASLRHQSHLRGNTLLIATELAHRMNPQGYGCVSYQFLAWKAHCCRRTAINQIARLLEMGLIRKTVMRTKEGYAWNHYHYIGPRLHTASPPVTTHGARIAATLPEAEREKDTSLRQDLERQRKGLRFWSPGSEQWAKTCEEIARLEALLALRETLKIGMCSLGRVGGVSTPGGSAEPSCILLVAGL